jgi:hypothetical protein
MTNDALVAKISVIANRLNHKLYVQPSEDDGANVFHTEYGYVLTLYSDDAGNELTYMREALTFLSEKFSNNAI